MPARRRAAAISAVVVVVAVLTASAAWGAAAPRVVGGPAVGAPAQAPWSVLVIATDATATGQCTGSILDATHVLTAGHCTFDDVTSAQWPIAGYVVRAGLVAVGPGADLTALQERAVTAVRVHPGFKLGVLGDDVAVLTLATPLDLSGPAVAAIAVAGAPSAPGSAARLFGWGLITPTQTDGAEHSLDQVLLRSSRCAAGVATILCASTPTGASCSGDSGGGLVTVATPPQLIGVLDIGIGAGCSPGDLSGYADLAQPEIAAWLAGSDTPPLAPRTPLAPLLGGDVNAGGTLTCTSPPWSGAPVVTVQFVDADDGRVLQSGPASYVLSAPDIGHRIVCISVAANAGGSAEAASAEVATVAPALDPGLALQVDRKGNVRVAVHAAGRLALHLSWRDARGRLLASRSFLAGQPVPGAPRLAPGRYRVCVSSDAAGIYAPGSACVDRNVHGDAATFVRRGSVRLRGGRFTVTLRAAAAVRGRRAGLTWVTLGGGRATSRVSYAVLLRDAMTLRSPRVARGRTLRLDLRVPGLARGGAHYDSGTLVVHVGRRAAAAAN